MDERIRHLSCGCVEVDGIVYGPPEGLAHEARGDWGHRYEAMRATADNLVNALSVVVDERDELMGEAKQLQAVAKAAGALMGKTHQVGESIIVDRETFAILGDTLAAYYDEVPAPICHHRYWKQAYSPEGDYQEVCRDCGADVSHMDGMGG